MPRRDTLPRRVQVAKGQFIPVIVKKRMPKKGALGYFNTKGEIGIRESLPNAGKHLILLHELIHLVAEKMKQDGLIKRQPDEVFVHNAAGYLWCILAKSGLWAGVSRREVDRFVREHMT